MTRTLKKLRDMQSELVDNTASGCRDRDLNVIIKLAEPKEI